jgi:ribose 1,5-bisphosphokinase
MSESRGCLIYVCGPSGAGKDALLRHARGKLAPRGFVFPVRIITRPPDQSEKHIEMSAEEFAAAAQAGRFSMQWASHGLHYALPASVRDQLAAGRAVVVNGSREYLGTARRDFPQLVSVLITVPQALLEARLASRGREDDSAIVERLARNQLLAECEADASHENSGDLAASSAAFVNLLVELAGRHGVQPAPVAV